MTAEHLTDRRGANPGANPGARRSPLSHLVDELAAGSGSEVTLAELPFRTLIDVRAQPVAGVRARLSEALGLTLPERAGEAVQHGPRHALWLGPDWWLITDAPDPQPRLESELAGGVRSAGFGQASAVDVSAHRTTLALAGPHARDVLEHGCSLDLHPRGFGPGACAQT
ncbi:MAG: sarcosine oxidase subunit gamma, partial [Micromonosporaceae bacterium]